MTDNILNTAGLHLRFGDLVSVTKSPTSNSVLVKVKIKPLLSNNMTICQNYHNICELIRKNGFDACPEIKYWAVADMTNGKESKVVAFTVNENVIKDIKNRKVFATRLGDYVDNLFIHPSLRKFKMSRYFVRLSLDWFF